MDMIIGVVREYITGPSVELTKEEKYEWSSWFRCGYEISKTLARDSYPKYIWWDGRHILTDACI